MTIRTAYAIIDRENECLVILGRCTREQLERECERMNKKENTNKYYIKEVETW